MKGEKFKVLDHGHVVLLDYMGSDDAILEAARTCYQKGTKKAQDDRTLLRYLYRNRHTSPFESCVVKLHVKLPIFVERQWIRHRTFSTNELSARYSELPEEYYVPNSEDICAQSKVNKQGRDEPIDMQVANAFRTTTRDVAKHAFAEYHSALKADVARELARISLPLGTYTEEVWCGCLKNLLDFLGLRMDSHAQWEIRQYANVIGHEIVAPLFPWAWEAFQDYRLDAMYLSGPDIACVQSGDFSVLSKRERDELRPKLERLGINVEGL